MAMEGMAMAQVPEFQIRLGVLPAKWDGRAVFEVKHLAEIFDRSLASVYQDIWDGKIKTIKVGRMHKIPRHVVERMLSV